ncbi:Uncharacterised protein [uncultured archaeon]|nr:Uncharacterised protein [uncultured archaeon]
MKEENDNSEKSMEKSLEKSLRGKKSRAAGQRFEAKVRQDLEKIGWVVSKWMNTVDYDRENKTGKVVPAKRKYNPFMKVMTIGTGFPDFVCFRRIGEKEEEETIDGTVIPVNSEKNKIDYEVIGLEVKGNGYLDQIEKGMCIWLLENKIFSRILIAKKRKEGRGIEYIDFSEKHRKE